MSTAWPAPSAIDREVDREAEGIAEHERGLAGELLALAQSGELLVQIDAAVVERGGEALLLGVDDNLDQGGVFEERRVRLAHDVVDGIDELAQEGALDTEEATMANTARRSSRRRT